MKIVGDEIIFSSGRRRYAHSGIIGLSDDGEIAHGYDGILYTNQAGEMWRPPEDRLTKDDIDELADYMIDLWTTIKDTNKCLNK